jgi:two-component system, OmpR family, sensor histidine kinase SenX3
MKTSPLITRIAFGVIITFVIAQVVWWIIFQARYVSEVKDTTLQTWQKNVELANYMLAFSSSANLVETLQAEYPHLLYNNDTKIFSLDQEMVRSFERQQNGYIRMFTFEGPFFVLVVLAGLAVIARSLQTERELKKRQQNFLAAITHEFKTPMSTLRLLVETALFRPLSSEKQKSYLEKMSSELTRLEQTSEQVLAAAQLEHSASAPILESLELNSVIQGIVGKARHGLEARGATLTVNYSPESLPVSLDARAFSVVLNNLLDNALKYSPNVPKILKVGLERQNDLIFVHIDDEGIGIPEAELKKVFERFYRVGNEMTRESKGVGLGLHLVKSITEAMNGWVRVESNPIGKGTRFTVVLPRRVALTQEETTMQTVSSGNV